jgi:UDP-N-acetylmuramoylalanine--D-glutamate ligase
VKQRPRLPQGPFLIVGLARSGVAAGLALLARDQRVIGVDRARPDGAQVLDGAGAEIHLGEDGVGLLGDVRTVVKSPGVPAETPVIEAARALGLLVVGELELAWRMLPNELVAITGTNGKTTTTELVGHLYRSAGLGVAVAGNVGTALSALAARPGAGPAPDATVICEVSSFQLEDDVAFAPEAAVLLNLSPDHLDRHRSFAAYRAAKLGVFARQGEDDLAVLPCDLEVDLHELGSGAREVRFGAAAGAALLARDQALWWHELREPLVRIDELSLRGAHNVQNAMAAAAVCLARGVPAEAVRRGLRDFPGVAHRLEEVAREGGVLYVNDSKATNVASTRVALRAFSPRGGTPLVHLILGGQGKGQDFEELRSEVSRTCRAVYLIGEDAEPIAQALTEADVALRRCGDLDRAAGAAREAAAPGEVVLLSPACASFDQFRDFEDRGERFRELVTGTRARREASSERRPGPEGLGAGASK